MKKIVLLILVSCLSAVAVKAQSAGRGLWCPPGAQWQHMSIFMSLGMPAPIFTPLRTAYVGDTVISGQSCQKLLVTGPNSAVFYRIYTRADADRVWRYTNGQFYKMYDFAAQPGSSWTYNTNLNSRSACPITLVVDSVGQRLLGGQMRRWFVAHYQQGTDVFRTKRVYEGIGSLQDYLLPAYNACVPADAQSLLLAQCYGTTAQPGLLVTGNLINCQAIPTATHEAQARAAGFEVYPTIGSGAVTVKRPAAYAQASVRVFNLAGQLVRQQPLATPETILQLGQLPRGLYSVSVQQAGQPTLSRRIVLQ